MQNLNEIEELIKIISKLPGLGPKSAKRIILKLINNRDELVKPMAKVLVDIYKNVSRCNICGTLKLKMNVKIACKKVRKILFVEDIADQWSIELQYFCGYFHILGGTLESSNGRDSLLINSLIKN